MSFVSSLKCLVQLGSGPFTLQGIQEKYLSLTLTKNVFSSGSKIIVPKTEKTILDTYYKAMFVREPFERLAAAYRDQHTNLYFKKMFHPEIKKVEEVKKKEITFAKFVRDDILRNKKTTLETNQHWRSYEHICPCEVQYDFIGHFENLAEEAPQLLKTIAVDDYVTFPDYHPSKSQPYMLEYYSQLTKDEILTLGEIFKLDFKLFGYDFPGPLKDLLKNKTLAEECGSKTVGINLYVRNSVRRHSILYMLRSIVGSRRRLLVIRYRYHSAGHFQLVSNCFTFLLIIAKLISRE